jgi:hypothetical protein
MKVQLGRRPLLGAVIVAVAAAGGIAYASIPDSGGVIHACYNPSGTKTPSGAQLSLLDSDGHSCPKGQTEITWNRTGPPGTDGADGVSVTSEAVAADPNASNCPDGGSKFTAGDDITYACNGAEGAPGETGPPGPSDAYTNYDDSSHALAEGDTQTVSSLTVPAGSYVLSASVGAGGFDTNDFMHCQFIGAGVNGQQALIQDRGRVPVLGDATVSNPTNVILLRCTAASGATTAVGEMIATRVGTVTPSE